MNDNKINFKTPRTKVGTAMEITVVALILLLWGFIIHLGRTATFEVTRVLITHGFICTIMSAVMMVLCYFPKTFNIPKRNPRAEHYMITVELIRIVCILVILLEIASTWAIARSDNEKAMGNMIAILSITLLLVVAFYIVRIVRLK